MTIIEFYQLLKTVDPSVTRYYSMGQDNYTIFAEYGDVDMNADNKTCETAWNVQVDRLTKIADDPIALNLKNLLKNHPSITCRYLVDFDTDTKYIHHIYDCVVT